MSYHLLGDFETANSILETFRQSQTLNVIEEIYSNIELFKILTYFRKRMTTSTVNYCYIKIKSFKSLATSTRH